MAVSPHSISDLDLFLKILLPILVLAAIPLNVRGETWDKERHRPSVVGISVISMGLIIALVSGLTSWVDVRVKDDDSHTAESKETAALNQQAEHFKEVMKN